jgi:hypothetical protein
MSDDLAKADLLDEIIFKAAPINTRIKQKVIPALQRERKALYDAGREKESEALSKRIEDLIERTRRVDLELDAKFKEMLRIRNRYRERVR